MNGGKGEPIRSGKFSKPRVQVSRPVAELPGFPGEPCGDSFMNFDKAGDNGPAQFAARFDVRDTAQVRDWPAIGKRHDKIREHFASDYQMFQHHCRRPKARTVFQAAQALDQHTTSERRVIHAKRLLGQSGTDAGDDWLGTLPVEAGPEHPASEPADRE